MSHLPGGNGMPPVQNYHGGRRHDGYYPQQHMPPQHYQYYMPPQHHYYPPPQQHYPQWYPPPPYPQQYMQSPMPQHRNYQPQSPMMVPSPSHYSQMHHMPRPQQHTPQPQVPYNSFSTPPVQPLPASVNQPEQVATPSSTTQNAPSASTTPTTASVTAPTPPAQPVKETSVATQPIPQISSRMPFYPQLPWYSVAEADWPSEAPRRRRKRRAVAVLELPLRPYTAVTDIPVDTTSIHAPASTTAATEPASSIISETSSTNITTPVSTVAPSSRHATPVISTFEDASSKVAAAKAVIPAIPIQPALPLINSVPPESAGASQTTVTSADATVAVAEVDASTSVVRADEEGETLQIAAPPKPPSSWAALLRSKQSAASTTASVGDTAAQSNGVSVTKPATLADILRSYDVEHEGKIAFLEPRGLVNTGNMCYMNSILQILVFCIPFYEFLDTLGKRAVHSFKSDTPLVEAMIMFMREFNIIDSTTSVDQLRLRLKDKELEQYGDAFTPEFVYQVINRLPRFSSMRRGHQQDAEEFLGFLLEGLHDECARVMKKPDNADTASSVSSPTESFEGGESNKVADGWLEVGPKQKASITRSSGAVIDSPITKIFGGKLRSEFKVPGNKASVTLEPYQPLQLDIGDAKVYNITDALRNLTKSETIHGEFSTPRGPATTASKQVLIETLPPVLILHLKRFQYDNSGGTQKIWKKIGYPLDLELPKELFSQTKRTQYLARSSGLPKYRLTGVVYHHGKNASGGHYTVDIRRQDGREWIRIDDTSIRRMRGDDVAKEGGEEDPKALAAALENHKRDNSAGGNIFNAAGFEVDGDDEQGDDDQGWSQVNGSSTSPHTSKPGNKKSFSSAVNGASTGGTVTPNTAGKQTPKDMGKYSVKDNKVAYILFYQRIAA